MSRVRELANLLGNPQYSVPLVIVGGTNGKGSTAAILAAICTQAGYRTGRFTSPHLETVHERITIDGTAITEGELSSELERILISSGNADPPTPFEALTLAAWSFFHRQRVDLAVIEVGLGGRLDATNICHPMLSIITSIALDHQHFLGNTIESIASEKMGITRQGVALVTACRTNAAAAHIAQRARDLDVPLVDADEVRISPLERSQHWRIEGRTGTYRTSLSLPGDHQLENLALAVAAAEHLGSCLGRAALDSTAIEDGIASCQWPGRCEWMQGPNATPVLLDVAHNQAAAACLASYLTSIPRSFDLVFGVLSDKDAAGMLEALRPVVGRIILTKPSDPRSRDPSELRESPRDLVIADPREALSHAIANASGSAILVCGSHSVVGEIRGMLASALH